MEAGGAVRVEEAGYGDKNGLRVKNRGLMEVTQGSDFFRMGLDGEAMDGKLSVSRGKSEGHPGVGADWKAMVELEGKSIKKGRVGGSRNGGVDNSEGNCTIVVDEDFQADREARVSFPQDGGGQVGPADADMITFGMGGRHVPGGIESPCDTGERRRTLG